MDFPQKCQRNRDIFVKLVGFLAVFRIQMFSLAIYATPLKSYGRS